MVIKIQPPSPAEGGALAYNERKADGREGVRGADVPEEDAAEKGHVVATRNVPELCTLESELSRLRFLNRNRPGRKLKNDVFHMSVNPGKDDRPMDEATAVEFIDRLMRLLGYGDAPYRIYKHTDIPREHYHVVAGRIGQDGRKISDSFENRRAMRAALSLAQEYGFTVGLPKEDGEKEREEEQKEKEKGKKEKRTERKGKEETAGKDGPVSENKASTAPHEGETGKRTQEGEKDAGKARKRAVTPPFSLQSDTPAAEQYMNIHKEVLSVWSFSTMEQYRTILRERFNVSAEEMEDGMHYAGTDSGGAAVTTPVTEKELGAECASQIRKKIAEAQMKKKVRQRERLEKLTAWASEKAETWAGFRRLMERKGVRAVLHRTEDGRTFGITWIDSVTKCVWKGSETAVDMRWLRRMQEERGWRIGRPVTKGKEAAVRKRSAGGRRPRAEERRRSIEDEIRRMRGHNVEAGKEGIRKDDIYEDEAEKILGSNVM